MIEPVVAWVFTALLLVLLVVCAAAGRGAIRRNHVVGVRIPPLMQSDAAWQAGHAAGVLPSAVAFVVALVSGLVGLVVPGAYWGCIVAFVGGLVWLVVASVRAASAR